MTNFTNAWKGSMVFVYLSVCDKAAKEKAEAQMMPWETVESGAEKGSTHARKSYTTMCDLPGAVLKSCARNHGISWQQRIHSVPK